MRDFSKVMAAAVGFSAILTGHASVAQDLKSKFLDNFANAIVMQAKCKAWKINSKMAMPVMAFFKITTADISPGGRDWNIFQRDIQQAQDNTNDLDQDSICEAAGEMFGPNGVVVPNLMIQSGE
jgi:hypothetical protein